MQSGGGGGAGPSRNLGVGPVGRATSTSSAASPSSSSSAVSTPHWGYDSVQQQQPQQQIASRQLLRKPEVNEAILVYQASGLQGMLGGSNFPSSPGSMQPPQQSRKFFDLAQQHASAQDSQNRSQGVERQTLTPFQQAYYQYAYRTAQQQKTVLAQQQAKMAILGSASVKDQDMRIGNFKILELTSMQAANQAQASSSKNPSEQLGRVEKQIEHGPQSATDQRNEPKPPTQGTVTGQLMHGNVLRAMQAQQAQQTVQNTGHDQLAMAAQLQSWALERNIDLSQPANANLMVQLIPLMQSRMAAHQKTNESNMGSQSSPVLVSKPQATSPSVPSDSSPRGCLSSDISSQSGSAKTKPTAIPSTTSSTGVVNNADNIAMQQLAIRGQDKQVPPREPLVLGSEIPSVRPSQSSPNISLSGNPSLLTKNSLDGTETAETQYRKQLNENFPQPSAPNNDGGSVKNLPAQGKAAMQMPQQRFGFTKKQLHVLKAQILAFRRLKKGEGTLPHELLRAIVPPPVELQQPQLPPLGGNNQDRNGGKIVEDPQIYSDSKEKVSQAGPSTNGHNIVKEEAYRGDDKATSSTAHMQGVSSVAKEFSSTLPAGKEEQQGSVISAKSDQEVEHSLQKTPARSDFSVDRGKAVAPQLAASDGGQVKKPVQANSAPQPKDPGSARKYHGPLFDFPFFTRKHDSNGSVMPNINNNLTLAYDVKELLFQEGVEVFSKKRSENLRKIGGLLAVNLERKRIRPDLVLRLQIEEKKLRLIDVQARLRDEVDQQQQEITAMPDRPYRKFVRLCERQRMELARQIQATQKALREKQLKSIFQWRKKLLEAHWAIRDARTARNRGVAKYHERMLREFSKRKDDDRNKRMEALKNNDVERYREMLIEQQTNIPGDAAERYEVLSSFLTQTEEYLHKLGSKITAAKSQQEVEEAANAAAVAARLQGLSEEEVRIAAACAGEEVMIRNRFMEMNAPRDGSSVSKYYNLAHAINERVIRQPSMLRAGTLRDYQLVGLQWMLSLYNNKLNGILADEMGLGKTVQVMALVAYLMEFKGNYGPHLIIVPNAVLVNWKSELHNWLPSVSCIYYVGAKDQRSKLFSQEVLAMKFNVLVTTYEFIMYDRSKLSKIDWKYIIIDEAQRMKDRESVLARDLDRYRCQRRLLLTGTPLQNDLKELWSLLNLLLPEVFDNRKAFHDWFSQPFQKEGPTHNAEDDWLETEKKVIIIHRLHQILEPFMLRRRVEDVEGSLPPKVSIVLRCRMSAIQSAIYDWIKSTGTLRVDPEDEKRRVQKNPIYQAKETVHDVPSLHQVNRMIARSEEEVELFDQMDEELDWTEEMTCHEQVPKWLRASTSEVNATVATLSKKPSKNILFSASVGAESHEMETERKRGRPKGKKHPNYKEIDNENGEYSEASSYERNGYSGNEEEGEIGEFEDDEFSGAVGDPPITKYQSEDGPLGDDGYEYAQTSEHIRNDRMLDEAGSSGSSLDSRKPQQILSPISPQKFGSLSALDARPGSVLRRLPDELEEGEIAASGDSHVDHQQSESWIHDRDEGEYEQVVQPKIKRKRSIRVRPRHTVERAEEKSVTEVPHLERGDSSLLPFQLDQKYQSQLRIDTETKATRERNAIKHDPNDSSSKYAGKSSRESWDNKLVNTSGSSNSGAKMSDLIQRKCKNVISKLQRRIDKEGQQIVPSLTDLWKRIEKSGYMGGSGSNNLDLQKIDQRVDRLEYSGVMELVADVQLVLKSAMQFYGFSLEVRSEARKVHDLFFDLLKIAFPDTDFREARNALSFSSLVSTSTMGSSARQAAVGKRQKPIKEVESDSGLTQKSLQRRSSHAGEDTRVRVHMPQKESRVGCVSGITKELYQQDDSILTHPGELVICKKKRKDREKSMVKSRTGLAGPVSPPSVARSIKSPTTGSFSKDAARLTQQTAHQQSWHQPAHPPNGGSVGWANPVKKLRTDAGKRRPSRL
ncbi:hypothetical protein V6Z12_D07G161200 [Gossypium hirsutum]